MNKYFVDNPEMILGTIENKTTQFGLDTTCVPNDINYSYTIIDDNIYYRENSKM